MNYINIPDRSLSASHFFKILLPALFIMMAIARGDGELSDKSSTDTTAAQTADKPASSTIDTKSDYQ